MVDMGQADRSLYRVPNSVHEGVFSRHRERVRALMNEYETYVLHADACDGKPLLTFADWLKK